MHLTSHSVLQAILHTPSPQLLSPAPKASQRNLKFVFVSRPHILNSFYGFISVAIPFQNGCQTTLDHCLTEYELVSKIQDFTGVNTLSQLSVLKSPLTTHGQGHWCLIKNYINRLQRFQELSVLPSHHIQIHTLSLQSGFLKCHSVAPNLESPQSVAPKPGVSTEPLDK